MSTTPDVVLPDSFDVATRIQRARSNLLEHQTSRSEGGKDSFVTTELTKDSSLVDAKAESYNCYIPLNVKTNQDGDVGKKTCHHSTSSSEGGPISKYSSNPLAPLGFVVPWCWAAQEFLPNTTPASQQRDIWGSRPVKFISSARNSNTGNHNTSSVSSPVELWDVSQSGLMDVTGSSLICGPAPECSTPSLMKVRDIVFSRAAIMADLETFGGALVAAQRTPWQQTNRNPSSSLAQAYQILDDAASGVGRVLEAIGLAAPEGIINGIEGPREAASTFIGGGISIVDLAKLFTTLAQSRLERLEAAAATLKVDVPEKVVHEWIIAPLVTGVAIPLPLVEMATAHQQATQQKTSSAVVDSSRSNLKLVQKSILNPYPEGDLRCFSVRMNAIRTLLNVKQYNDIDAEQLSPSGKKRPRSAASTTSGGVSRVVCRLTSRNPQHAFKAATTVASYIDSFELDVSEIDAKLGDMITSMPLMVGRILRGINEGSNGDVTGATKQGPSSHRLATIAYLRNVAKVLFSASNLLPDDDIEVAATVVEGSNNKKELLGGDFSMFVPISLKASLGNTTTTTTVPHQQPSMSDEDVFRRLLILVAAAQGQERIGKEQAAPQHTPSTPVPHTITIVHHHVVNHKAPLSTSSAVPSTPTAASIPLKPATLKSAIKKLSTVHSADVHVSSGRRVAFDSVVGSMAEAIYQVSLAKDDKSVQVVSVGYSDDKDEAASTSQQAPIMTSIIFDIIKQ